MQVQRKKFVFFIVLWNFFLRKGLLVAPKLIFLPSSVRDCSPIGFGFLRSGTEQKAVFKKRKSPACVSRYAHLSIKRNLLQRANFFFYYINHFDELFVAFSGGVVKFPVVVKVFSNVGASHVAAHGNCHIKVRNV